MRRLRGPLDKTAFAQKTAADRVRRHENVRRLGMKMILRRAQEAEALLGNFEITGTVIGIGRFIAVDLRFAHKNVCDRRLKPFRKIGKSEF